MALFWHGRTELGYVMQDVSGEYDHLIVIYILIPLDISDDKYSLKNISRYALPGE